MIKAFVTARKMGVLAIGLTGLSGGRLRELADVLIAVPWLETPRIQECHVLIGHALCDALEQAVSITGSHVGGQSRWKD